MMRALVLCLVIVVGCSAAVTLEAAPDASAPQDAGTVPHDSATAPHDAAHVDAGTPTEDVDAGTDAPKDAAPPRQGACVTDAEVVPCPTPIGHIITWLYDAGGTGLCGYGGWSNDAACPTGHACTVQSGTGATYGVCVP